MNFISEIDQGNFHLIYIGCAALILSSISLLKNPKSNFKFVKFIYGVVGVSVLFLGFWIGIKTALHGFIGYAIIGSAFFVLLQKTDQENNS